MSIIFRKAEQADLLKLKALWAEVFDEAEKAVDLFFDKTQDFIHGYLAEKNGEPVSALYLLDGSVNGKKAHYLCGAATKSNHRRRGIMGGLLEYSLTDAKNRGDVYSLLYPANSGLYNFYAKFGYTARCKSVSRVFSRKALEAEAEITDGKPDYEKLQKECFKTDFLLQSNQFIEFAAQYYGVYGVKAVSHENCFALFEEKAGAAVVFYCVYNDFKKLCARLLKNSEADEFAIYGKSGNPDLSGGTCENAGMVKLLDQTQPLPTDIYIGINLN